MKTTLFFCIVSHLAGKSSLHSSVDLSPQLPNPRAKPPAPNRACQPQIQLENITKHLEKAPRSPQDDCKAILHLFPHPSFQRPACLPASSNRYAHQREHRLPFSPPSSFDLLLYRSKPARWLHVPIPKDREEAPVPLTRYQTISRIFPSVLKLHFRVTASPTTTGGSGSMLTVR